jgi:hypothetical protein
LVGPEAVYGEAEDWAIIAIDDQLRIPLTREGHGRAGALCVKAALESRAKPWTVAPGSTRWSLMMRADCHARADALDLAMLPADL